MTYEQTALSGTNRAKYAIWVLALAAFVIVTTEFVVIGLVPALSRDLGVSVSMAGQLVTVFSVVIAVVGPFMAAWLSRYERRKLFTWILILFAIGNAASAVAPGYWSLMCVRLLPAALVSVFWGVGSEAAGQISPKGQGGKAVAHVYFGVTAALLLGLPLGTVLGDAVGWRGAFWVLAVLSLGMAVTIHQVLPVIAPDTRQSLKNDIAVLKNRFFLANLGLSLGIFTAIFTAYTYLADLLERTAGVAPGQVGWWLMGFGAMGLIGNYVAGRLVDRHGLAATVIFCFVLATGASGAAIFAQQTTVFVICLIAWGIAHTALFPLSQVRVMNSTETGKSVAGTLNISAANGGIASGAIVGGWAISAGSIAAACVAAAILAILCGLLSPVIERRRSPGGTR